MRNLMRNLKLHALSLAITHILLISYWAPRLKGKDGKDGAPGAMGPQGIQGPAGKDCECECSKIVICNEDN